MDTLKKHISRASHFLSRFQKQDKKRGSPKLIKATRKNVNILVLTGLGFLVFIGILGSLRAITLSSKVTTLEKSIKKAQTSQVNTTSTNTDYRLTYYLNDFVSTYFTFSDKAEEQEIQIKNLNSFYDVEPEIKSQGQKRTPMSLVSAKLLVLTDTTATYQVTYKQKVGDKEEEITTGINVPYGTKNGAYYVSGLPWYSHLTENQAHGFAKESGLNLIASDNLSESTHRKIEKFLKVFFTNYTTDQDNLDLVGKDLIVIDQSTFNSLDYVYLKEDNDSIIAYVQVTFEVLENTHSENFTLTLTPKGDSYYVTKVAHTIPKDYAKQEGE